MKESDHAMSELCGVSISQELSTSPPHPTRRNTHTLRALQPTAPCAGPHTQTAGPPAAVLSHLQTPYPTAETTPQQHLLHASSKAAAHACCGGAPAPFPCSATDRARHRLRKFLFRRRTADPSHTDATMWPKHAPETSAPTTNLLCCPRGFHVHASTPAPMCLHHAHLLAPGRTALPLRRVRRALIAIQPKGERAALGEKCFCRQKTQISRRLLTSVEAW